VAESRRHARADGVAHDTPGSAVTVIERAVSALVLTHAHFDHVGFAARVHRRGTPLAQAVSLVIRRATWYLPTEARLPGVSSGLIAFSVSSAVR
jgi:glyoxylase-like metal-dependent hydrolase (beta-lactamase superfamily II)